MLIINPYRFQSGESVTLKTDLIAHYALEETSGTTVYDSHGSHHGVLVDGTLNVPGVVGNSYGLDGSNDRAYFDNSSGDFNVTTELTLAAWVRINDSTINSRGICGLDINSSTTYKYMLYATGGAADDTLVFYVRTDAGLANVSYTYEGGTKFDDSWFFMVGTFDANLPSGRLKLYVDGTLVNSADGYDSPVQAGVGDFEFGRWYTYFLPGGVDEISVWKRALSDAEIATLYNNGNGLEYSQW